MQCDKDNASKVNLQSKLRLKRNNSNSCQNTLSSNTKSCSNSNNTDNQESCSNDQSPRKENESRPPNAEDSLADFKSPKEETAYKPILNKFKIDAKKVKKKILKPKNQSNIKSRKSSSNINQPSIESSFFKPQNSNQNEIKESVPCPLCLRPFKDDATCTNHMKTCAAKNKFSVKQLIDAKKLQDRQSEERKAMGLLATPVLPERRKVYRSKNYSTGDDPQLQLVLAMSESLYQAEQMEQLEQAALLAGIPSEYIKEMNDEERKTTLQNFGFTTNKPVSDISTNRSKKRKLHGPTILQTRSKEDKDRVLTERIACILTGDDALTQAQQKTETISRDNTPSFLKSKILKEIEKLSDKLWDKSRLTKKYDFYVEELKSHLLQLNQQLQKTESLDFRLLFNEVNDDDEQNVILSNSSIVYEPLDIDVTVNQDSEKTISNLSNICESESMNCELDFMRNLISNWRDTLNDSAASDLLIFVKNNKHIYAHKLVFHVQCSNILLDTEPNDTETQPRIREKISWLDKDQISALAFLEFIYCGIIYKNISVFDNDNLLSEVKKLAKLYHVKELFTYIRIKQKELAYKRLKESENVNNDVTIIDNHENCVNTNQSPITEPEQECDTLVIKKHFSFETQATQINNSLTKYNSDPTPFSNKKLCMKNYNDRRITASPDLFESEDEEETIYSCKTQENNQIEESGNNTNLKILVDLIDEDEKYNNINTLNRNTDHSEENSKKDEQINSQQTVVNLSGSQSPRSDKSFILSPINDIHEAVTPKYKGSPERYNDVTLAKIDYDDEEIAEAVTPKYRGSPDKYNDITPERQNYNDIAEAVTPKYRGSPEGYNDLTQKKIDYDNEKIAKVVTPKSRRSPEKDNNIIPEEDDDNIEFHKAITPESDTISRLNDHITPKKLVYVNVEISAPKEAVPEIDEESMYTAVTPPKSDATQFELKGENIHKLKTDLSLFIDKVKKMNAKSALDTDSETDTPEIRVKHRNPFLKKHRDDSYAYLRNDGHKNYEPRRAISLLEKDVLEGEKKSVPFNQMTHDSNDTSNNKLLKSKESCDLSTNQFPNINLSPDLQDEFIDIDEPKTTENSLFLLKERSQNFKIPEKVTSISSAKKDNEESINVSTSDDEIHDITINEREMSIYSRYKKSNKYNNSIEKYRKELNLSLQQNNSSEQKLNVESKEKQDSNNISPSASTSKQVLLQNSTVIKPKTVIEDITLVSDSDDEEHNNLESISNQKELCIQKNSTLESEKKNNKPKITSDITLSNIEDDTTFPLDLVDDNPERSRTSNITNSTVIKEKSKRNVIYLSIDSDDESIHNDSTFPYNLAVESDNSLKNKKCNEKELFSGKNKQKKLLEISEKKNDDVDAEISKILQLSPEFTNDDNLLDESKKSNSQEKLDRDANTDKTSERHNGRCEVITLSPISIISSPEICDIEKGSELESKNPNKAMNREFKKVDNLNEKRNDEFDSFENECFNEIDFNDDWITKSALRDNSAKNKSPKLTSNRSKRKSTLEQTSPKNNFSSKSNSKSPKRSIPQNSQIPSLMSSPILSQNRRKLQETPNDESSKFNKSKKTESESTKQLSKEIKKLKTKSASASNISEKTGVEKCNLQRSSSFVTPDQNRKLSREPSKHDEDVTPPVDYSRLKTPELQRELKKYGLKPQNRNKAKLLLRHIYNETHPVAPSSQKRTSSDNTSSEDEPPFKKQNLKKTCKKNILIEKSEINTAQTSQTCPIIAEEMDYDEPDAANALNNPVSIKDVFFRLLETNKELYTKVLTYEPLPLESLHLILKQNGFKCKINTLMNFLDEQCITFQVQTGKGNRTKKKKK